MYKGEESLADSLEMSLRSTTTTVSVENAFATSEKSVQTAQVDTLPAPPASICGIPSDSPLVVLYNDVNDGKDILKLAATTLLRKLGYAPSNSFLERCPEVVDFRVFVSMCKELERNVEKDSASKLAAIFEYFDQQALGTLTVKQVTNILTQFGEPHTAAECREALRLFSNGEVTTPETLINYRTFCKQLLQGSTP
eukprot:GHVT01087131.1.p1 GENE.GHVT01087131.1~~GHVT01087131.1.p1  ORF type:complete len:196 (-),score=26.47 GHVT01087131.1:1411-1998(-)